MNRKSKEKFMKTKYAKRVVAEQKMYKSISSQRFTISKGVRLRTWGLPEFYNGDISSPEIADTKSSKKSFISEISKERAMELHDKINRRDTNAKHNNKI